MYTHFDLLYAKVDVVEEVDSGESQQNLKTNKSNLINSRTDQTI